MSVLALTCPSWSNVCKAVFQIPAHHHCTSTWTLTLSTFTLQLLPVNHVGCFGHPRTLAPCVIDSSCESENALSGLTRTCLGFRFGLSECGFPQSCSCALNFFDLFCFDWTCT